MFTNKTVNALVHRTKPQHIGTPESSAGMTEPLQLLDLPLDILKTVLKHVTHTNDLAALALTSSALHGLVTPLIYSRFEIIWPDALNLTEPRTGVDALTYGLATLVMREDLFENAMLETKYVSHGTCQSFACKDCGHVNYVDKTKPLMTGRLRRGNFFSQFVKKFSLGDGPEDLVRDYLVTKEGGKMLGTLVALTVARMPNLESFVWDMPTGILRDVWIALSSLSHYQPQKLNKVFIRFHDNEQALRECGLVRSIAPISQQMAPATGPTQPISLLARDPVAESLSAKFIYSAHHVESPNFSILPPLRSLSAVAINELANLNELSLLIGKSVDKLRELRVGIAENLHTSGIPSASRGLKYLMGTGGLGTLLLLFSGLPHCRPKGIYRDFQADGSCTFEPFFTDGDTVNNGPPRILSLSEFRAEMDVVSNPVPSTSPAARSTPGPSPTSDVDIASIDPILAASGGLGAHNRDAHQQFDAVAKKIAQDQVIGTESQLELPKKSSRSPGEPLPAVLENRSLNEKTPAQPPKKLKLDVLELERHSMNTKLLKDAIDWTLLTTLTLLKCVDTESLWQDFRTAFAPSRTRMRTKSLFLTLSTKPPCKTDSSHPRLRRMHSSSHPVEEPQPAYRLNLKRIHTDTVSKQLILFLKETLAPNSLEWLFLQDCQYYQSGVTAAQIHKSVLKRHCKSLTKFLLNSSHGSSSSRTPATSAKKWMLNREILAYVTSPNKMPKLRELSIALEYKDWHFFLQQLPNIQGLRSLHVPFIADHVYGSNFSVREVAMGVIDVLNLRKECELAYLGVGNKCFEIVETRVKARGRPRGGAPSAGNNAHHDHLDDDSSDEDVTPHASDSEDASDDDDSVQGGGVVAAAATTTHSTTADVDDDDLSSSEEEEASSATAGKQVKMRMREILFYDDKISIFKARHGQL